MHRTNCRARLTSLHTVRPTPAGFTLVELLVTIGIIAALAAILLPAVNSARRAARIAAVRAEIAEISAALDQFNSDYGMYPPSSITLFETGADWSANNATAKRSKYLITKLWPNFNFDLDREINSNSTSGETIVLQPAECLVFFLGGMPAFDTSINKFVVSGFANDPENPFDAASKSRKPPHFRFVIDRLAEGSNANNIPAYIDNYPEQTNPILYFSSYNGAGYDNAEAVVVPGFLDVYRQSWTLGATAPATFDPASTGIRSWNETTFQLVSPGPDSEYGVGGFYAVGMAQPSSAPTASWSDFTGKRQFDVDNIVNFTNGELR